MSYFLLISGMAIDIISCFLFLKITITGKGSSGIPIITLFLYWIYVELQPEYNILCKIYIFGLLFLFHIIVQYIIPIFAKLFLGNK